MESLSAQHRSGPFHKLFDAGLDASIVPHLTDTTIFSDIVTRTFRDQPRVLRRLAALGGTVINVEFDGKDRVEIPTLNDIERPTVSFRPRRTHTALSGGIIDVRIPYIFQTYGVFKEHLKQTFAGHDRFAMVTGEITRKIMNEEDLLGLRGNAANGITGLIDAAASASDLGNPAGNWGIDNNNNGFLENFEADTNAAIDEFNVNNLGDLPIDVVMTSYIYTLLKNAKYINRQGTNLQSLRDKINGGEIFVTNNLQASVTSSSNTILYVARAPPQTQASWGIVASGMKPAIDDSDVFDFVYALIEKMTIKVFNADYIRWQDGLNVATS